VAVETSQTLDRGLRALRLVAESPRPLTVTEVAAELRVSRTVAYRLIATLQEHRLARRDDQGRVQPGFALLHLAGGVHRVLTSVATPVLRSLAEEVGATAHLTVAEGADALAIAVVEPTWTDLHVAYRVGARHPLERGAAGRAILLGRAPAGGDSAGYVTSAGELQSGASGLAAPIRSPSGVEASVGVVALSELDPVQVGPVVAAAAREIARRLA
jgi:DNA-binding IclR family transcriptional regulator